MSPLVFDTKKQQEQVVTQAERVNLTKASYSPVLSSIVMDEDSASFHATWDRVTFRTPLEVIQTVLEANGFAKNFENILSCLDSFVLAVRVKSPERAAEDLPIQAKSFLPCVSFELPTKKNQGPLLKKFYAEIESYESEIARLKIGELSSDKGSPSSREQMKKELARLEDENEKLQLKIQDLAEQLAQSMRSQAHVAKALESQNIIPPQLKTAVVREISIKERKVYLKSGRSNYAVPLALLQAVPKPGDHCLINIIKDLIVAVYFYETQGKAFTRQLGEVLYVEGQSCKVRSSSRRTYRWDATADWEQSMLATLERGSTVILYLMDEILIKMSVVIDPGCEHFMQKIQEKQTIFQLEQANASEHDETGLSLAKDR